MDEKILKKFLILLDKGYDKNYCLSRFKGYEKELRPYLDLHLRLGDLKTISPDSDYFTRGLERIYKKVYEDKKNKTDIDFKSSHAAEFYDQNNRFKKSQFKMKLLKPSIIFLSIFLILILSFTGTLFASQESLPSDPLYGMKRTVEVIQLKIIPHSKEGEFHLMLLSRRLYEAEKILNKNDLESDVMLKLLDDIDFQYKKCVDFMSINSKNKDQINETINKVKNKCRMRFGEKMDKSNNQKMGPIMHNSNFILIKG